MHIFKDTTQLEVEALKHKHNLSDAHTHQSQSKTQLNNIVNNLPNIWLQSEKTLQYDSEQRFIQSFFRVHKQHAALDNNNILLTYAASISIAIIAMYLKNKKMTASLLHPCFDNIVDLLKYTQVPIYPLNEELLHDSDKIYKNLEKNVKGDTIFLIDPNNPTGFTLFAHGKKGWNELIRFAKDNNKLLIFDFCFTAFMFSENNPEVFDRYELLEKSGVSYISLEDTGKTWPLQDTKVSMIKMSADLYEDIHNMHSAYLLNVSPFVINIVTEYILDSEKDGFKSVSRLLEINREIALKTLENSILEPIEPISKVSVMWCKIIAPEVTATELQQHLAKYDVHVLPGTYFFWHDHKKGEKYIRIALSRNTDVFTRSINALSHALNDLKHMRNLKAA